MMNPELAEAPDMTDREAYRLMRNQNAAGITHLYAAHAETVCRKIAHRFPELEAEDIVQAAFLNMLVRRQAEEELRDETALGYVYTAAVHEAIDTKRKLEARPVCVSPGEYATDTAPLQVPDHAQQVTDRVAIAAVIRHLPYLLDALPERQRQAVTAHLDGLGYEATARLYGFSIGTVKSTLSRGLTRLQRLARELPTTRPPRSRPTAPLSDPQLATVQQRLEKYLSDEDGRRTVTLAQLALGRISVRTARASLGADRADSDLGRPEYALHLELARLTYNRSDHAALAARMAGRVSTVEAGADLGINPDVLRRRIRGAIVMLTTEDHATATPTRLPPPCRCAPQHPAHPASRPEEEV